MVKYFAALALLIATPAFAGNYVVTCSGPCVASDGTTQPTGTVINRILADPTFNPGAGLTLQPDTGQAIYAPPAAVPTTIAPEDFINRFSVAEQQAIVTATQTNWQLQLWMNKLTASSSVDVTDPRTTGGIQALVSAGLLTAARGVQVLNLAVTSP